eukprot:TRINITY_DN6235_c0_g1_i2.p1 TRINITY_DN6235_c0_g1~~TRINITY_DN6235_c0_g1_i2.p1  ORF type:complete len:171 (+),score=25.59 TRINITY_DN6235_c0_g1_i2:226-738(+)
MGCSDKEGKRPRGLSTQTISLFIDFLGMAKQQQYEMDEKMVKIGITDFSKEIIKYMNQTVAGENRVKYLVYSGHLDTETILLLALRTMNKSISTARSAEFASNILIELFYDDESKEHQVVVKFDDATIHHQRYESFRIGLSNVGDLGTTREYACQTSRSPSISEILLSQY